MKTISSSPILVASLMVAFAILLPNVALAQATGDAWVKPATGLIDSLRVGMVQIGAAVVAVGIIGVGIWAGLSGRMDWSRFGYVLFGGVLVMAGPSAIGALLATVK